MSFWSDVVADILNASGWEIPWRKVATAVVVVLLAIGFFDREALTAGTLQYVHEQQCRFEQMFASDFVSSDLPPFSVVTTSHGCTLKPVSTRTWKAP
jgi:hypothetical protein